MGTFTDPLKIILRRSWPTTTPVADTPTVDNLEAVGVIRGVEFTWDLDVSTSTRLYYSYHTKITFGGTFPSWKYLKGNHVRRELTSDEINSYGLTPSIYIEVRAHDYSGYTSSASATNAAALTLGARTLGTDDDIADGTVNSDACAAALTGRMFTTSDRNLDETTEHGGAYHADEDGADVTSNNTANDVSHISGTAVATVVADIAEGKAAYTKLTLDGVETDGNTIESTAGSQAKVDARLSSTEKTNLAAEKTIDGNHLLYHEGNKPTPTNVGLGNVPNYTAAQMVENGLDVGKIVDTGIKAANIGAVDIDGSNAPENILNSELSVATTDVTDYIVLKRDISGVPTKVSSISKAALALDNVENKSSATIRGEITGDDIKAASGFTLDDIPDGTIYKLVSAAKEGTINPARIIWSDGALADDADATPTERTCTGGASPVKRDIIKVPYVYSKGDSIIHFKCFAKSTTANEGHIQIKIWSFDEASHTEVGTEIDITSTGYTVHEATFDCTNMPLNDDGNPASDGDVYMIWILLTQDVNAEVSEIMKGVISVTK